MGNRTSWQPTWRIDVSHNCEVGLKIDDHCFVALVPAHEIKDDKIEFTGEWKLTSHIPKAVAEFMITKIAEL